MAHIDDLRGFTATHGRTHYGHTSDHWRMDCDGCERIGMSKGIVHIGVHMSMDMRTTSVDNRTRMAGIRCVGEGMTKG